MRLKQSYTAWAGLVLKPPLHINANVCIAKSVPAGAKASVRGAIFGTLF